MITLLGVAEATLLRAEDVMGSRGHMYWDKIYPLIPSSGKIDDKTHAWGYSINGSRGFPSQIVN